jgi:uncharacterized delta-60 repeat protein
MKRLLISLFAVFGLIISLAVMVSATTSSGQMTSAQSEDSMVYLPLIMNNFPFIPDAPVLNAISNDDGDGNYTVSWSSSEGAETYTLQEDDNADFSTSTTVYSGPNTSATISDKDVGTYYYRVRGSNTYSSSSWSNTRSVIVTVPPPDCPQTGAWLGTTDQERLIRFEVENSPQCQIAPKSLRIYVRDNCQNRDVTFGLSFPITNNHFVASIAGLVVIGDFPSSNTADGTFSVSYTDLPLICEASGTWSAAPMTKGANHYVYALTVQADGKILVGGAFTAMGEEMRHRIARLKPDGTIDAAFNPGADGTVRALAVQADGKILVGGNFDRLGEQPRANIGRLNSDGTLDAAFFPEANGRVRALSVQADGKILVGGDFTELGGQPRGKIARLNADGTIDAAFNPGANGWVDVLAVQADGKIVAGGSFSELGGQPRGNIGRLNPDGTIDATFNPGASYYSWAVAINALEVQADGKILVAGFFNELGGQPRDYIGRLNPNGTVDAAFNPKADNTVYALAVQVDGKILVAGAFWELGGQQRDRIARLNADGTIDAAFNPGASSSARALAVQPNGKILVGGLFWELGGQQRNYIGRLNPDGTLDAAIP